MQAATRAALRIFSGREVVAVGVAGALPGDDANADAQGDALGGALDDRFVDADGAGGEVFEVQVGVIAAWESASPR